MTPAMAAGLTDMAHVARLIDDTEMRLIIQKRVEALALPQSN
jgi:hypothetical protein